MALEQGHDVMKLTRMNLPGRANVHLTPGRTMMRWLPGEALSRRLSPPGVSARSLYKWLRSVKPDSGGHQIQELAECTPKLRYSRQRLFKYCTACCVCG